MLPAVPVPLIHMLPPFRFTFEEPIALFAVGMILASYVVLL